MGQVYTITRMMMYPYVVWSAIVEAPQHGGRPLGFGYYACCALLLVLLGLQCFWFKLLCKAVWGVLTTGSAEDNRSDSDTDGEEDEPHPRSPLRVSPKKEKDLSEWKEEGTKLPRDGAGKRVPSLKKAQ